ncbi:hypothetical protein PHLCEN_2v10779 [Hermanssonia centrifuga]|uniref:Uncharacterized protein n=1 Tax=Hermanssonia centrifuga TaxID=98765 RepID=A0A2R6NM70_9APHY|nr:hypothetical protein PHLCEN_2v10779 [Hermanssonia centrifuga]
MSMLNLASKYHKLNSLQLVTNTVRDYLKKMMRDSDPPPPPSASGPPIPMPEPQSGVRDSGTWTQEPSTSVFLQGDDYRRDFRDYRDEHQQEQEQEQEHL